MLLLSSLFLDTTSPCYCNSNNNNSRVETDRQTREINVLSLALVGKHSLSLPLPCCSFSLFPNYNVIHSTADNKKIQGGFDRKLREHWDGGSGSHFISRSQSRVVSATHRALESPDCEVERGPGVGVGVGKTFL